LTQACAIARKKSQSSPAPPPSGGTPFAVEIHQPPTLGYVEAAVKPGVAPADRSERIACVTCHSQKPEQPLPESSGSLQTFHKGLVVQHGTLKCAACHDSKATHRLHLADGTSLDPAQALELCAQCHGPQYRDYQHGAHGGMLGYWDLRRGPRSRNHCVDCHEPHVPAFQPMQPVMRPRDRFLTPTTESHHD
jgi:hypothetical protein